MSGWRCLGRLPVSAARPTAANYGGITWMSDPRLPPSALAGLRRSSRASPASDRIPGSICLTLSPIDGAPYAIDRAFCASDGAKNPKRRAHVLRRWLCERHRSLSGTHRWHVSSHRSHIESHRWLSTTQRWHSEGHAIAFREPSMALFASRLTVRKPSIAFRARPLAFRARSAVSRVCICER